MKPLSQIHVYIIYLLSANIFSTYGYSASDVGNLLDDLFVKNNYRKNVPPLKDQDDVISLDTDLYINALTSVNEKDQKMVTNGYLFMMWYDEYLKWNPEDYNGIQSFRISQKDIWRPDVSLKNGFNKISELGNDFTLVKIKYTGKVYWIPPDVYETKCTINIRYFPFDEQSCDIEFWIWMSSKNTITFSSENKKVFVETFDENAMWHVIGSSLVIENDKDGEDQNIKFTIRLKRRPTYYVINLLLPLILLGLLTVFSFALPVDSGEKMGYSLSVFLTFTVFLSIITSELPKTSGSLLGYYMIFELTASSIIVCFSAIQLRFHNRNEPIPNFRNIRCCFKLCSLRKNTIHDDDSNHGNSTPKNKEITWSDVFKKLDIAVFWIVIVVKSVVLLTFLLFLII